MSEIETPIQVANNAQTALTFDPKDNFADDREVQNYIEANIQNLMEVARSARQTLDSEWLEIQKMAFMRHGESQAYKGKSNAYIPAYSKNLDTRVSHISKGLFPTDDYLSASATTPDYTQFEQQAKAWMQWQLNKRAHLRSKFKPFLRQLNDFGVSVAKIWYQTCAASPKQGRVKQNPLGDLTAIFDDYKAKQSEGIRVKTVNMFSWHMWPLTVSSIEEAVIVFEDQQVSKQWAQVLFDSKEWKNPQFFEAGQHTESETRRQEQLQVITDLSETALDGVTGEVGDYREISEVYVRMPVPKGQYLEGEVVGSPVPCQLILVSGMPVVARRNPFWFQKPPYVVKTLNERADSMYSIGIGRQALDMQSLLNDFTNQTNDNGIFGLNPMIKLNPAMLAGRGKIGPGEIWYLHDLNGLEFDRPPVEQLNYGISLSGQQYNWMNDLLGAPMQLQGTSGKGAAKTATGAQILQNNVKTDIQDVIESIEEECLEPLMDMAFALGQQYEPVEQTILRGGMPMKIDRQMWEGGYGFTWNASSQNVSNQARAQQAMQLLQIFGGMVPLLQQTGKMFNPEPLMRRLYTDGLGFKNFDEVIVPAPPMMPGMPGPGGGAPPEQGAEAPYERTGSAVDQAAYGQEGMGMAPGEGEELGDVRNEADELAALMGGNNGQ